VPEVIERKGPAVFEGQESWAPTKPPGRYQAEIVSGEMREKSHQGKAQVTLDEGSSHGWRLVSATTTYSGGFFITGIYWDTTPGKEEPPWGSDVDEEAAEDERGDPRR
jgi:hypothetical protein